VALANTYYLARLMRSDKPEDHKTMEKIVVVWPDQQGSGTHINVSGGGVLKTAPHKDAAVKFLEYLFERRGAALFCRRQQRMAGGGRGQGGQSGA
jgi:iron(III) transport system substrate-binding protein